MKKYIEDNICPVHTIEVLKENKFRSVYLINTKLVIVFSGNAQLIFDWYMRNQNFAPNSLFATDKCICYDFLVPNSEHITKNHVKGLINNYQPECIGVANDSYYLQLDIIYRDNCSYLDIEPKNLDYPSNELLYQIHGNMHFNHTIYYDGQPVLLDPRPKNGTIAYDIINFYYSSIELMTMFSEEELTILLGINTKTFNFYKEIILVKKIRRLEADSELINVYKQLRNN